MSDTATVEPPAAPAKRFNFKRVVPTAAAMTVTPTPAATVVAPAVVAEPTPPAPAVKVKPVEAPGDDITRALTSEERAELAALKAQLAALKATPVTAVVVAVPEKKEIAPVTIVAPAPTAAVVPFKPPAINSPAAIQPAAGAVVEYKAPPSYGDDSDSIGVEDINLPRLNIVQKVGDLSNVFTPGDIVFGKELVLRDAPEFGKEDASLPLRILVCGFRPDRYVEKTTGGQMGDIVDSEAQVFAKGHTTDYNENKANPAKKYYQQLAEALILIEKPEHVDDPRFSYAAGGKFWAPALWAMKGTAFTNGAKVFRTARKAGWLRDEFDIATKALKLARGYTAGIWELRTFMKEFGGNWAAVPSLKKAEYSPADVQTLAQQVLG